MSAADERWMAEALALARVAEERGEVPIGAVVVRGGERVARGHNQTITARDPSAHAEIVALRQAGRRLGAARLPDVEVFVTLEPCVMCVGAMIQARVKRLVFACRDAKAGAVVSLYEIASDRRLNHRIPFVEGPLAEESRALLQAFFCARRSRGGPRIGAGGRGSPPRSKAQPSSAYAGGRAARSADGSPRVR